MGNGISQESLKALSAEDKLTVIADMVYHLYSQQCRHTAQAKECDARFDATEQKVAVLQTETKTIWRWMAGVAMSIITGCIGVVFWAAKQ